MVIAIAGAATAGDPGISREPPAKNSPSIIYTPPAEVKEGGDTIDSATEIPFLPFLDTGSTCDFINDYDEVCPYSGSISPDVVYSFTSASNLLINVDLCRSNYDTKVYIYDSGLNLIACNDDYHLGGACGIYTSKIERAPLLGGETYYIVIDGFSGQCGNYEVEVTEAEECILTCPADAVAEGEPPLGDGYVDNWNGGCFSDPVVFQSIDWINDNDGLPPYDGYAWLCGRIGYYLSVEGEYVTDIDWFTATALETGEMEFTVESEHAVTIFKVSPLDCATTEIEIQATGYCGIPATMTFPVTEGEEIWLVIRANTFLVTDMEYTYFATLRGHYWVPPVPIEGLSWGGLKALYR
jgi:hypothetical protein